MAACMPRCMGICSTEAANLSGFEVTIVEAQKIDWGATGLRRHSHHQAAGRDTGRQHQPTCLAVYDCRFVLDYCRMTADKRLLFGGGTNYSGRDSHDIAGELRSAIKQAFPRLKGVEIELQWSAMMGIVINRIPQLGKLSKNVWYAQGYPGHGVATSHIVGEIMANAVSG
jgi:gamma-glutamylputrescine oxidase